MLKYVLLFCALSLAACQYPSTKKPVDLKRAAVPAKQSLPYGQAILNKYSSYLNGLDTTKMESAVLGAKKYAQWFATKDEATRDSAYLLFDGFFAKLNNGLDQLDHQDLHLDSLVVAIPGNDTVAKPRLSAKLSAYAYKLKENGFYVYMSEGDTYIGRDYDFVAKWFYPYVSAVLKEYLAQLNKEEKEGFQEDAGLTISPVQLADRAIWWEKFTFEHPGAIISGAAKANWSAYMGTLLNGMDNTPIMDYDPAKLSDYYSEAYTYLEKSFPASQTNKLVNPYFKLLLKNDRKQADVLLKTYEQKQLI
nr:hypothetical protein [uncultured Mucilaginibacter sp.]